MKPAVTPMFPDLLFHLAPPARLAPAGDRRSWLRRCAALTVALLFSAIVGASSQIADDCVLHIAQHPSDVTAFSGQTVTFTVVAEGAPSPATYQWQWWGPGSEPFTNIPPVPLFSGASITLRVSAMDNGAQVRCLVGNGCGKVVSAPATLTVLPSPAHDFTAEGLSLTPLGDGVYEVRPQVGITAGPDALLNPLPLDFLVLVNGVVQHDGRGANSLVRSTCDDEDNCTGGCWVAVNGERRIGRCQGAGGECGCNVSTALSAMLLALVPGDVVQFVLDPDNRVPESDETNNSVLSVVTSAPAGFDFLALGLEIVREGNEGLCRVTPKMGFRSGPGTSYPLPLGYAIFVNNELRHEVRTGLDAVHSCPTGDCAGMGCFGAIGGRAFDGYCDSGCGCVPTNAFASLVLMLSPGDVVQLVLDPDQLVDEMDEANNTVAVTWVNHPPVLASVPNQAVHAGTEIRFVIPAIDPDGSAEALSYTLDSAPAGVTLDPVTGEFQWTPTAAHIGRSNLVIVRVTDNGLPPLSDSRQFLISVAAPPVIVESAVTNNLLRLTWTAVPGNTYRIEAATDLASPVWTEVAGDLSAQAMLASWTVPRPNALAHRFYRIALVAAVKKPGISITNNTPNLPAWTCCERDIQFPATVNIGTSGTTGLTNNNTRRFVVVDVRVPLEYSCANVPDQDCIADLAVKVVFRPRQADDRGNYVGDVEEEVISTIRTASPPKCDDKKHTTVITIRWRGTYKAAQDIKGTLNLELSVPGAKGAINHTLSVDVASANSKKAENPVLDKFE